MKHRLSDVERAEISRMRKEGQTYGEIAAQMGIKWTTARYVCGRTAMGVYSGLAYKDIRKTYDVPDSELTPEVRRLLELFGVRRKGLGLEEIRL